MYCKNKSVTEKLLLAKYELLRDAIILLKHLIIKVNGESMMPTLIDSEKVVIDPILGGDDLQVGDIILFYDFAYDLVLHRLIYKEDNKYILKGDNGDIVDSIEFKNIIGKVNSMDLKGLQKLTTKQFIKKVDDYIININVSLGELISINLYKQGE